LFRSTDRLPSGSTPEHDASSDPDKPTSVGLDDTRSTPALRFRELLTGRQIGFHENAEEAEKFGHCVASKFV
jgi:hypothetical protein